MRPSSNQTAWPTSTWAKACGRLQPTFSDSSWLDSGRRKIVFVSTGEGRFEPREIATGLTGDHHVTEVISGLSEGDEVVVSGQFLLDSESQLQEVIRKMLTRRSGGGETAAEPHQETVFWCPMHPDEIAAEAGRCPVCGMDLEERGASPGERARLRSAPIRADEPGGERHPAGRGRDDETAPPAQGGGGQP